MAQWRKSCLRTALAATSLLATTHIVYAGDPTPASGTLIQTLAGDAGIFVRDAGMFFSAPLHFSPCEWLYAGGAAGGSVLLMTTDREVRKRVGRDIDQNPADGFWNIPTRYGEAKYAAAFVVATYATGLITGSDEIRITGRLLLESLTLSGASAMAIRYLTGRSRPYGDNRPWDFNWFETSDVYHSFPSGHTVVAFALSTVLAERIDNTLARVAFYGVASLTAFARVHDNQHWASDVIAGAGIGLLGGLYVVGKEKERDNMIPGGVSKLRIQPSINGIRAIYLLD